jgi:ribosomal protein S18 acetylase RimI-like enzyme
MIRRFEEISNNAWPALQTIQYDGWILRFANGVTKRSNSVSLLYPSTLDPEVKIGYCENLFIFRRITPCFKITTMADPAGIDQRLKSRGYFIHSTISFQSLDLAGIPPEPYNEIALETELHHGWIDDFIRMNEFDKNKKATYISIMEQVYTPKCLVSMVSGRTTIGVGFGVLEDHFIGIFDIVVDKAYRNTGVGYHIVDNILRWGKKMGAETAYLQVLTDNNPAISLYEKMGFKECYQYWYRMKKYPS